MIITPMHQSPHHLRIRCDRCGGEVREIWPIALCIATVNTVAVDHHYSTPGIIQSIRSGNENRVTWTSKSPCQS